MKFFIDSANIEEIRQAAGLGMLDGVTTNPSLIAKEGKKFEVTAKEICDFVKGPVSLEVVSTTADEMVKEALKLREYGDNVVVKVPMIPEGLKAVSQLSKRGIPTNVTLIFQPLQALLAAKAGATYVSPFVGRLDDIGQQGMDIVGSIRQIFQNYAFETQILVASIRGPMHLLEAAELGAHVATLPLKVIHQLIQHPLTDSGLEKFLNDWKSMKP